jgi:hypothetical protein
MPNTLDTVCKCVRGFIVNVDDAEKQVDRACDFNVNAFCVFIFVTNNKEIRIKMSRKKAVAAVQCCGPFWSLQR